MIVERTSEGKSIAKSKPGFKEGRPSKYTPTQLEHALSQLMVNGGYMSYNELNNNIKFSI
jgi:hypothetical protein